PTSPGNTIVPGPNGTFIEIGEDGVPLGEWHWDEPTEQWILDEYPPLANLPQTGATLPAGAGGSAEAQGAAAVLPTPARREEDNGGAVV
ncbi:MAG: hypothetical protein LBD95_07390, partial [Clostridiales Family XIII bacterium]|nr:hypothetical protein [Clostridiales Family XIII bacterium]